MEPNNNQSANPTTIQQPVAQPVTPANTIPTPGSQNAPQSPKSNNGIILIIIILLLVVGMLAYILFAKNQLNSTQKITSINSTTSTQLSATVAPTASPTPASADDINVASPGADLQGIEKDLQAL